MTTNTITDPTGAATPMSPTEAVERVRNRGPEVLIDIRTPVEVAGERVDGAHCIPLDELPGRVDEVRTMDGERLLLCRSGKRAEKARQILADAGVHHVRVIAGGILAYAAVGGETKTGQSGMSLERQVRIAAGALVLTGVILGFTVAPGFFGLSAFVGLGLVFAGLTDWCGMGLLLAKMPWNKRG